MSIWPPIGEINMSAKGNRCLPGALGNLASDLISPTPFPPQHKCTEGRKRILLLADGYDSFADGEFQVLDSPEPPPPETLGECQILDLATMSVDSIPALNTIKLMGELCGFLALILVVVVLLTIFCLENLLQL